LKSYDFPLKRLKKVKTNISKKSNIIYRTDN